MLINVRHLPEERVLSAFWKGGFAVGLGVFLLLFAMVRPGVYHDRAASDRPLRTTYSYHARRIHHADGSVERRRVRRGTLVGNSEAVGMALYRDYLVPFEIASLFLLVAMVGAIVIGKRELSSAEEETTPDYMLARAKTERDVKEAMSA